MQVTVIVGKCFWRDKVDEISSPSKLRISYAGSDGIENPILCHHGIQPLDDEKVVVMEEQIYPRIIDACTGSIFPGDVTARGTSGRVGTDSVHSDVRVDMSAENQLIPVV